MAMKAIIIDDDTRDIQTVEALLESMFPEIDIVDTSNLIDEGFQKIHELKPDIVFLDIRMPRGEGSDLLERFPIRRFEVVIVSVAVEAKSIKEKFEAFDIVEKPINIDKFRKTISEVIKYRKNNPDKVYKNFPDY